MPDPPRMRTWKGTAAVAVLVLLALVVRWNLVLERRLPARGDTLTGFIPHKAFSARVVRSGELPLWDPHIVAGQPFLADPQTAVFSPLSLPFYILPLVPAFVLYILIKHVLAGAFTYGFLRCLGANRPGALLGAVAFSFSSSLFRQIPWQEVASSTVWMPLLFWICEALIRSPRRVGLLLLAPWAFAFENLAGHPQLTYYVYMALATYVAIRLATRLARTRALRSLLVPAGLVLLVAALGAGLAMLQALPLKEFMDATRYGDTFSVRQAAAPSSTVSEIPRLFLGGIYPGYEDHINTSYIGILPLLLVPAGLLAGGMAGIAIAAAGALALLVALGLHGPLFEPFFHLLPGFRSLHGPVRFLPVTTFAVALLAGLGAGRCTDLFTPTVGRRRRRLARPIGVALLIATASWIALGTRGGAGSPPGFPVRNLLAFGFPALTLLALFAGGWIRRRGFVCLALLLSFADLMHFDTVRYPNVYGDPSLFLDPPATVRFLRRDPGLFRALHMTNGLVVRKRIKVDESLLREQVASLYPNLALLMGTYDAQGAYSLKNERFTEFARVLNGPERGGRWIRDRLTLLGNPFSPLYDLLNVKYLLTVERNPLPLSAPLAGRGGSFPLEGSPSPATGMILDLELPAGDAASPPLPPPPTPFPVEIRDRDGSPRRLLATPARGLATPPLAAFFEFRAPPAPVREAAVLDPDTFPGGAGPGWSVLPGRESLVDLRGDRVVIRGTVQEVHALASCPIPRACRISVRFEATPLERDDTGVLCSLLDASSGEPLYSAVLGDEGYSGILRGRRGVAATRRLHSRRGAPLALEFLWEADRLSLRVGGKELVRFRDVAPLDAEAVRVVLGARGGAVRFRSAGVWIPVKADRRRTWRARVDFPRPIDLVSMVLPQGEAAPALPPGARLTRVTLLDTGKFRNVFTDGSVTVYENRDALPRAFLAGGYRAFATPDALLEALGDPRFDPRAEVLLEGPVDLDLPQGPHRLQDARVEVQRYEPNRLRISTRSREPGILVVSDANFPGWEASVDGTARPILDADHVLRGVPLGPGEHVVKMRYRPRSFRSGLRATCAALLAWLLLIPAALWTGRRRGRRPPGPPALVPAGARNPGASPGSPPGAAPGETR